MFDVPLSTSRINCEHRNCWRSSCEQVLRRTLRSCNLEGHQRVHRRAECTCAWHVRQVSDPRVLRHEMMVNHRTQASPSLNFSTSPWKHGFLQVSAGSTTSKSLDNSQFVFSGRRDAVFSQSVICGTAVANVEFLILRFLSPQW